MNLRSLFVLMTMAGLFGLSGCGAIDSVPLPDNSPVSAPGSDAETTDSEAGSTNGGDEDASGDGTDFAPSELENYVVSVEAERLLAPSGSLEPEQQFQLRQASSTEDIEEIIVDGETSGEGAVNAPLGALQNGTVENRVDGTTVSTWCYDRDAVLDTWAQEALSDLIALRDDPMKTEGFFTLSQCGDSTCLTVRDALSGESALVIGVFSQAFERGVVKTIVNELVQIPLPPNYDDGTWRVVVGSEAQKPLVSDLISIEPPDWD